MADPNLFFGRPTVFSFPGSISCTRLRQTGQWLGVSDSVMPYSENPLGLGSSAIQVVLGISMFQHSVISGFHFFTKETTRTSRALKKSIAPPRGAIAHRPASRTVDEQTCPAQPEPTGRDTLRGTLE